MTKHIDSPASIPAQETVAYQLRVKLAANLHSTEAVSWRWTGVLMVAWQSSLWLTNLVMTHACFMVMTHAGVGGAIIPFVIGGIVLLAH